MTTSTDRAFGTTSGIPHRIQPGLLLLLEAYDYAADLSRNVWDFAVELPSLCAEGLSKNDFRWLVCRGFVEHSRETTLPGQDGREFRPEGDLTFTGRTCFVLTEIGIRAGRTIVQEILPANPAGDDSACADRQIPAYALGQGSETVGGHPGSGHGHVLAERPKDATASGNRHFQPLLPNWDSERHELRLANHLVKVFKLPSPNQETVLMAFQEENWPPRIDDPLPPALEMNPKRRLRDTIKSLNRKQKSRLIRFMGDGTGEGVRWELIAQS